LNVIAREFGYVPHDPSGPRCSCGRQGCWEVYASTWAALRYYHDASASNGPNCRDLLLLAEGGDTLATKAPDRMAHGIGRGMRMVIAGLSPEEVVLVGEFTRLWDRMGPVIEAEVAASVLVGKAPRVRPAGAEPSVSRLRGPLALVLQKNCSPAVT